MNNIVSLPGKSQHASYPYAIFAKGDKVNLRGYTDIRPGTVVDVRRNGTEVHVRSDSFKLAEGQKPAFVSGGFAGHCTNQSELVYDIAEDPQGSVEVFTLRNWRGRYCWTVKGQAPNGYQAVSAGWRAFYDYNF